MDENTDDAPHPLSPMVSIGSPHFWIFLGACIILFICNKFLSTDNVNDFPFDLNETLILSAAFAGLFLNLIHPAIQNIRFRAFFNKFCLAFEILTALLLVVLVFIKLV